MVDNCKKYMYDMDNCKKYMYDMEYFESISGTGENTLMISMVIYTKCYLHDPIILFVLKKLKRIHHATVIITSILCFIPEMYPPPAKGTLNCVGPENQHIYQ